MTPDQAVAILESRKRLLTLPVAVQKKEVDPGERLCLEVRWRTGRVTSNDQFLELTIEKRGGHLVLSCPLLGWKPIAQAIKESPELIRHIYLANQSTDIAGIHYYQEGEITAEAALLLHCIEEEELVASTESVIGLAQREGNRLSAVMAPEEW